VPADEHALEALSSLVLSSVLASAQQESFNGIRADVALRRCRITDRSPEPIAALLQREQIDCVFQCRDGNPYIKRLTELDRARQLSLLDCEALETFCLYPSRRVLAAAVEDHAFRNRPFSRALMLGEAQLDFVAFDLAVLGRYRADPRYRVTFEDYAGHMAIRDGPFSDDDFPDRDKISVQSFGLGFDEEDLPYVIAFHRYLADLTPDHQQYWNSFRVDRPVQMCRPYFQSSVIGDIWENHSVREAIAAEMELINVMAEAAFGSPSSVS